VKLVIQIPAWDEEEQIAAAVRELPRQVPGFDSVEVLVVDDGSTDATSRVAKEAGADHVLKLGIHRGLAVAWRAGLDHALALGADVVVSTDADRQYAASDVVTLVGPILSGEAEIVVGDRGVATKPDFSPGKRLVQRLGSWVVRRASGTDVPDATSGFRALTREAALRLNVYSRMTYTTETLIQAGHKNMAVRSVRVGTNPPVRPSRLFRRTSRYVLVQAANILRMTALYKPLPVFLGLSAILFLLGAGLFGRYAWILATDPTPGAHLQSLLLATVFLVGSFLSLLTGLLAELISINRTLMEEILLRLRRREAARGADDRDDDVRR
jgi:glycosyltransferase involved in cell wall biosynthesis